MKNFEQSFLFYLLLLMVVFKGYSQEGQKEKTSKVPYYNAVQWVDPMIDAANSRWFYFSSACWPFGMVNLSPDTRIGGAWGAGYRYERDTIVGFSHIHAWQLAGVSVLPVVEDVDPRKGVDGYESKFSHQREEASPGYHYVHLDRYGVDAELTSTTRVGFHRYTFPASEESRILFNLGGRLGPSQMTEGEARIVNDREIAGYSVNGPTRRRPKEYPVFFVARFSKPFESMDGWQGENLMQDIEKVSGSESGIMINFNTRDDEEILMKVGISYCSPEQARLNLETELTHWDFDRVVKESAEEWNNWLSKIQIRGASDKEKIRFYTDLWHALQGRRIISDVNGKYSDYTGEKRRVRQLPTDEQGNPEFNYYNSDSFWGAQWTLNTLWHLVYPEVSEDFVNSMLTMYKDGGLIPRGPSGGNYTFVMTGASSTPFIVSAWQKGIRGFDAEMAYEGMKKNHLPGGLMSKAGYEHATNKGGGIEYYMDRGYVPEGIEARGFHLDGAGMTLEYAYQDWCLAQMADALGKDQDKERFLARSRNYRNLYNPSTGWMRPKNMDGIWIEPFEPLNSEGFVESNAAQMTWFVPHDVKGLAELMGGYEALTDKLNRSFERARPVDFVDSDSWVNYSNQPSMQMAHIFNYSETPWLTQYWTRQVIETSFSGVTPQSGYNGDEDQGLMGALSVLMKTGLFELHGGAAKKPFYEIGSPIFDKITIYLNNDYYPGEKFVIETFNNKEENYYIQSASLNQSPHNKPFILHEKVIKGGKLELRMGDNPNKSWGEHSPSNLLLN